MVRIHFFTLLFFSVMSFMMRGQEVTSLRDSLPAAIKEDYRFRHGTGTHLVSPSQIRAVVSASGEADYIKYIQTLPGVSSGADGSSAIYVRGGNLGNNVVTLDGVPIYGSSHLLGMMSVLSNEVVGETMFRVGGFSSDEGNLTASHIRLYSAEGDWERFHGSGSVSNFMLGASVTGPLVKNRVSLVGAARWSPLGKELQLFNRSFGEFTDLDAGIYDIYGKVSAKLWKGSRLDGSLFRSDDSYRFTVDGNTMDRFGWDNLIGMVRWEWKWRGLEVKAGGYWNRKNSRQIQEKETQGAMNTFILRDSLAEKGFDGSLLVHLAKGLTVSGGYSYRQGSFNPGSFTSYSGNYYREARVSPMIDNREESTTRTWHVQGEYELPDRLSTRVALRRNAHQGFANTEYSAMLRIGLMKGLAIEGTFDNRYQYYHTLEGIPVGWSLDMIVPADSKLPPEKALQYYGGIVSDIGDHHFTLGGYWKEMDNLVYFQEAADVFSMDIAGWKQSSLYGSSRSPIQVGSGLSYGLETSYGYTGKRLSVRAAYTWSKTDRYFRYLNEGKRFPAKFDRPHIFNLSGSWILTRSERKETGLTVFMTVQSGCCETVPAARFWFPLFPSGEEVDFDYFTTLNNYRMPTFFRTDAGWYMKIRGDRLSRELHLGIYNLTNRHNPFMITYNAEERVWKQISLLPIMPSVSYRILFHGAGLSADRGR